MFPAEQGRSITWIPCSTATLRRLDLAAWRRYKLPEFRVFLRVKN